MEYSGITTELKLATLLGDKTGWLHVRDSQILRAEVVEGIQGHLITNINIQIDVNSTLHVPVNMTVDETQLVLAGTVTFNNLVVENGGQVQLKSTSLTATFAQNNYIHTSEPGAYTLGSLDLKRGSVFSPETGLQLQIGVMEMKRFVVLYADFINITAGTLILERGAELNVDGRSLRPSDAPGGHGGNLNGGAYASEGGVGQGDTLDEAAKPYGTIYTPVLHGSNGGNGGHGGGFIYIRTDNVHLDGVLSANGASSPSGGGGSGGSIYVICDNRLSGLGRMQVDGGDAHDIAAGAGSGGKIAVHAAAEIFLGSFSAAGGSGDSVYGKGGPGSIYQKIGNGLEIVESLKIDNTNGQGYHYMTLDETSMSLNFDVVDINNYAKLQVKNDNLTRNLNIKKINGDGTGLLRMRRNQTGTLERYLVGNLTNSKLEINLELHDEGEFVLSETTTILGKAPVALDLNGRMRGVINLILGSSRKMRMGSNARTLPFKDTQTTTSAQVTFGLLQLDPGSFLEYDPNTGAEMVVSILDLKFGSKLVADYFNISCSSVSIEVEARLSSASDDRPMSTTIDVVTGAGSGYNQAWGGSGHGGIGGQVPGQPSTAGQSYGSLYHPKSPGSRSDPAAGKGGGKIYLNIGNVLINDGEISVNGSGSSLSGGSGGSILIESWLMHGYGVFSGVGGNAQGSNGGGSAGRIALYTRQINQYEGAFLIFGGDASVPESAGGGGTVYIQEIRNGLVYNKLFLDNLNRPVDKYAVIDEIGISEYNFNELHIMRQASLRFAQTGSTINVDIRQIIGDRSGLIHLHNHQHLVAVYEEAIFSAFTSGVNFILDQGSELIFPSLTYIYGVGIQMTGNPEKRSIQLFGRLTGVSNLVLGQGSLLYMNADGHTAMLSNGTYSRVDSPGNLLFGTMDLRSTSTFKTAPDVYFNCSVSLLDARYKAVISAESVFIQASKMNIEAGANITTSAGDRPLDQADSTSGQGLSASDSFVASAAGHASSGGGRWVNASHPAMLEGGEYYDSVYYPQERGSVGGDNNVDSGGQGGGIVRLIVAGDLLVDGDVKADATAGDNLAGGGSGGSIYLTVNELLGHGALSVQGGNGGSGGSGGRIAVYQSKDLFFHGDFQTLGGVGNGGYKTDGGPGSLYLEYLYFNQKYNQLRIHNGGRHWDQYYILDEGPMNANFYFNELHLQGNASIKMKTDGVSREMVVVKLYGDKTGRIHMRSNHTYYVEEYQPQTKSPANIWIDEGARAYLSPLVYILGLGEVALQWNGEMIGVRHLRIVPGRLITIGVNAQTSIFLNGTYMPGTPGIFRFGSFELGAKSQMAFPPPIGLRLIVGILVSVGFYRQFLYLAYLGLIELAI